MTPQAFISSWTNTEETLSTFSESRLDRFNLLQSTADFLNIAGLPPYCEPNLSFANDTDDVVYGINRLTQQYDFGEDKSEFDKYIVFGYCRDGDAIAIDTSDNDKIVELDHQDLFSSMYFNSSIETLADFLILYDDFQSEVLKGKDPDDNFQCFNFTDEQFEKLKSKMHVVDSRAITERGFWKEELEIMLSIRKEKFETL
ncbi:SUKH-4 family immunity protein [Parasediminibacterium sp. JCM 36343]|uniref:SUKH-4 family immunity protein n=1 Tax=Parasediminibacterium sp. JCM 36343 TaxID=3374279 RepID=UPI003979B29E